MLRSRSVRLQVFKLRAEAKAVQLFSVIPHLFNLRQKLVEIYASFTNFMKNDISVPYLSVLSLQFG